MQKGVSLARFDRPSPWMQHHRSRYPAGGPAVAGGGGRLPPFGRGGFARGAGNHGHKQFYPPPHALPPPPPPPPPPLPPQAAQPRNKYEILMEAGRLAAEYLVVKGVLPPGLLQRGWAQPPQLQPQAQFQQTPALFDTRNARVGSSSSADFGRRKFDDEYANSRSRRSNGSTTGRGKRKFGFYKKGYPDWGKDRERNGPQMDRSKWYPDSHGYEDEDDGAPGYQRARHGGNDEVGSSVSGVAGEGPPSKAEAMGESELEDTGSKTSSSSNVRKDAPPEMEGENDLNKMQEDSKVSNSELEQGMNVDSNNGASSISEEPGMKPSAAASDDKAPDGKASDEKAPDEKALDEKAPNEKASDEKASGEKASDEKASDVKALDGKSSEVDDKDSDEKASDDKASDEKALTAENCSQDNRRNLLHYCDFARVPTRLRSALTHRNAVPGQSPIAVADTTDLVSSEEASQMVVDEAANGSSLTNPLPDNKDSPSCHDLADHSAAHSEMTEQVLSQEKEASVATEDVREDVREEKSVAQHYAVDESKEPIIVESPTMDSHDNSLKLQGEEETQICKGNTPLQDEEMIELADQGKLGSTELFPNIGAETIGMLEEEKLDQPTSFKICDLNLVGSPEVTEIPDPGVGHCSTARTSIESQNQHSEDFGMPVENNANGADAYGQIPLDNKAVQVIDLDDDSPIEVGGCNSPKPRSSMIYQSMENMMNPAVPTDVLPGIQDGYSLAISDYLGSEIPCYQSMQSDLQAGMGLNVSEGITVMDDPIYGSLSDIGFMEVWDQPAQDYEKFF